MIGRSATLRPLSLLLCPDPSRPYRLDFGNDGTFGHAAADVTGDLVRHTLRCTRGRTLQSPGARPRRAGWKSESGTLTENTTPSTPPRRSTSATSEASASVPSSTASRLGAAILDDIRYVNYPIPYIQIIALGLKSTLRQPVSVASQSSEDIGAIAQAGRCCCGPGHYPLRRRQDP